jgi:hypothetical protein
MAAGAAVALVGLIGRSISAGKPSHDTDDLATKRFPASYFIALLVAIVVLFFVVVSRM